MRLWPATFNPPPLPSSPPSPFPPPRGPIPRHRLCSPPLRPSPRLLRPFSFLRCPFQPPSLLPLYDPSPPCAPATLRSPTQQRLCRALLPPSEPSSPSPSDTTHLVVLPTHPPLPATPCTRWPPCLHLVPTPSLLFLVPSPPAPRVPPLSSSVRHR